MNNELFSSTSIDSIVVKKATSNKNSSGKSAYIEKNGSKFFTLDKSCKVASSIKPGNTDGTIKQYERFNMEVTITPEEEAKANELDAYFLKNMFENKTDFFGPSKAKSISSVESIKPMYKFIVREGTEKPDGTKYPNTFRMKVDGWSDYCEHVNVVEKVKEGNEKIKYVKDCSWKNRIVGKDSAPLDQNTIFYLVLGENELGKPKCTDRIPVKDSSDNFVLDEKGNKVWRYVGPQDCTWNSQVTVLWHIQKLYVTESTGPTLVANKVYIKQAPKVASNKAEIETEQLSPEDVLEEMQKQVSSSSSTVASDTLLSTLPEEIVNTSEVEESLLSGQKKQLDLKPTPSRSSKVRRTATNVSEDV